MPVGASVRDVVRHGNFKVRDGSAGMVIRNTRNLPLLGSTKKFDVCSSFPRVFGCHGRRYPECLPGNGKKCAVLIGADAVYSYIYLRTPSELTREPQQRQFAAEREHKRMFGRQ